MRIMQWENMTQADPENAMGWFSLGNAYKDADRTDKAIEALRTCLEKDDQYSRAYQLLGQLLIEKGETDEAGELLERGYKVAAERGDVMPQKAMGSLLTEKLGRGLPDAPKAKPRISETGDTIVDRRTNQPGPRMPDPPMRGPIGKFIYDHYSMDSWREWLGMGTKVINEFRLDFSNPEHQKLYDEQMMEWLGFTRDEAEQYQAYLDEQKSG